MTKLIYIGFSLILLVYMIMPGPKSVSNFSGVPTSIKSQEPGDTIQAPNVAGYYSNVYREEMIPFYRRAYTELTFFPFAPLRLNYPPEFAYVAIKDQTHGTYLEELVYPLRDSLFINGWEPFTKDGEPRYTGATPFTVDGVPYNTKATIRYYPSSFLVRLLVWAGISVSIYLLWKLGKRLVFNG
jgi:hypothetical protein